MKISLGDNIKRLRKDKCMTQENLAELLNISSAAVSKWESNDTYPDITMLFPLARIFDVSVDELMGYNSSKIEADIKEAIERYWETYNRGSYEEAKDLIIKTRKLYPNDYKVMVVYMWCLAGGAADNDPKVLIEYYDEFMQICNTVLNNSTDDKLRKDALNMKAKLYHAKGETNSALEILNNFPDWYQTSAQKIEQLYSKDTDEFKYWIVLNQYELFDFAFNKLIKSIWYVEEVNLEEKVKKVETFIDSISELSNKEGFEYFALFGSKACSEFCGKLSFLDNTIDEIIRFREKQLELAKKTSIIMKKDKILSEYIMSTTKGDYLKWLVNHFKTSEFKTIQKLRENPKFIKILEKYE